MNTLHSSNDNAPPPPPESPASASALGFWFWTRAGAGFTLGAGVVYVASRIVWLYLVYNSPSLLILHWMKAI